MSICPINFSQMVSSFTLKSRLNSHVLVPFTHTHLYQHHSLYYNKFIFGLTEAHLRKRALSAADGGPFSDTKFSYFIDPKQISFQKAKGKKKKKKKKKIKIKKPKCKKKKKKKIKIKMKIFTPPPVIPLGPFDLFFFFFLSGALI